MNALQKECDLTERTWWLCQSKLPRYLQKGFSQHEQDPCPLDKKDHANYVARLRILPITRNPKCFWNSSWCFFEILVGAIDGSLGGIQFLQFSDNGKCGSGQWHDRVVKILSDLRNQRSGDFLFHKSSSGRARKPQLYTRYRMKQYTSFPVEIAAGHLAWLIEQTAARFKTLKPLASEMFN